MCGPFDDETMQYVLSIIINISIFFINIVVAIVIWFVDDLFQWFYYIVDSYVP